MLEESVLQSWLEENWQKMSDEEMASVLKIPKPWVARLRYHFGFKRKRGRPKDSFSVSPNVVNFLRENWQRMDDEELAHHLGVSSRKVKRIRMTLGLSRSELTRTATGVSKEGVSKEIDPVWLRRVLLEEGLILKDVAEKFGVTGERIRQIAKKWGIDTKNRTPRWYAFRHKRPQLAEREWLEFQLEEKGIELLVRQLNLGRSIIRAQAKRLKIDLRQIVKERAMKPRIQLTCSWCGGKVYRKERQINRPSRFRKRPQTHFFCNRICFGKFQAENYFPTVRKARGKKIAGAISFPMSR